MSTVFPQVVRLISQFPGNCPLSSHTNSAASPHFVFVILSDGCYQLARSGDWGNHRGQAHNSASKPQYPLTNLHSSIQLPYTSKIHRRRNLEITHIKAAPKSHNPINNHTQILSQAATLPSQASLLTPSESKISPSKSSNPSTPDLVSSFQEALVGLNPPLVQQDQTSNASPPLPPTKPPKPKPSTSLAPSLSSANKFKVLPTHAFHTHRFVKQLEQLNLHSELAKQILNFVETSLESSEKRWLLTGPSSRIVSKSYAKGQAYLYNAALGELQTEMQVKARNDGIVLKSASNSVQREINNLKQKLKEDISALENELQLEFNHCKEEASDGQKKLELSIQELNSKFTILVSGVRTEIETRKSVTTRQCVVAIASLALCVVIFTALENSQSLLSPSSKSTASKTASSAAALSSSSSTNSGGSADDERKFLLKDQIMRSVEELGILQEREDFEAKDSSASNSFFGTSSPAKRIVK
ncbi:hypothetical protein PCASD_21260 [Puccinia coronata f. sp. avenae]|uniref:Uncharacterized protein n=1 Tax=Puccinia coronata f. sp. avenae TaxID=200324 RepID=A0A2N5U2F5_9BASI|nr:hypothetical protein PCASD_21260 [Puccinia coronata f. sp. avenae]